MDFEPCAADTVCNIGDCMSFREHVGDLLTGFNIPFRDIVILHDLNEFSFLIIASRLSEITFSGEFHNSEGIGIVNAITIVKNCHNIVTAGNDIL